MIQEQRGVNVELGRECFLGEGGCVRVNEQGGTEVVASAIKGRSLPTSGLNHARGISVNGRSPPRSTREACWEGG